MPARHTLAFTAANDRFPLFATDAVPRTNAQTGVEADTSLNQLLTLIHC
jgi:hypothetical protein